MVSFIKPSGRLDNKKLCHFLGISYNTPNNIKKSGKDVYYNSLIIGAIAMANRITPQKMEDIIKKMGHNQPHLIIMRGLPGSGKSTYIKENVDYKIVSFDNYLLEITETDNYNEAQQKYMSLSDCERKKISLEQDIYYRDLLLKRENIVVDYTNLTTEWLDRWLDVVPNNYKKSSIVLDVPFETILERNKKRPNKSIPINVLENMRKSFCSFEDDRFDTTLIIKNI